MPVANMQRSHKARRVMFSSGGVLLFAAALVLGCGCGYGAADRAGAVRTSVEYLPAAFVQAPPLEERNGLAPACRGSHRCGRLAEAPGAPPAAGGGASGLAPALLALALGALAARRGVAGGRRGATRLPMRGGSVEQKKFLGDWASLSPSQAADEKLPRELVRVDLGDDISQIRGIYEKGTERYGEEFALNEGSTDNVFLITPPGRPSVLVGVHDECYAEEFIAAIGKEALDGPMTIILQFFDGKQTGTIDALIKARPATAEKLKLYCSNLVAVALKKKLPAEDLEQFTLEVLKNKSTLEIEEDRVMRFMLTPTPKTPEGCVAFDPKTGTLFTGKFFSAHRSITRECSGFDSPGISGWEDFSEDWFHLFDCYFFTQNAQTAIRRLFMLADALKGPDVQQLAPIHGPVVREQCWKLMAKYEAWTEQKLRQEDRRDTQVLVMYASAYGHTKHLANSVAEGLKSASVNVNMLNLEHTTSAEVTEAVKSCNGLFIGSPTLGGEMPTQVKEALGIVLSSASSEDTTKVPCGVFGSYGWSGEAVDELHFRLKDGGFPFACDPIRVRFRPTPEQLELCKEAGVRMSQKLQTMMKQKQKSRVRTIDAEVSNSASQAFGMMRSSLCAISTKTAEGDDLVTPITWVNQASFDPPGITVAVAKKDLDPFLNLDADKQLEILFNRYDVDGGGTLDREEVTMLLKELFGASEGERSKLIENKVDDALKILDEDNDGSISLAEIKEASENGPLADELAKQRKLLALEAVVGSSGQGEKDADGGLKFTLNLMPENTPAGALTNPEKHPKAKPKNGLFVAKDANAYIECSVTQVLDAGDHTVLYARVMDGKVLKGNDLTGLVSVVPKKQPAPAMAAVAGAPASGLAAFGGGAAASVGPTARRTALASGAGAQGLVAARPGAGMATRTRATAAAAGTQQLSGVETWTGLTPGKEYKLQTMTVGDVAADTTTVRSLDWDRDRFDIEFALERGTTYNAYVIKGADKTAMIDTSHEKFEGLFFEAMDKQVDYATLGYLIVSHTEPDHSGLIAKVVEKATAAGNEDLTVVGSKVCIQFLENLIHSPFKSKVVGNGDKLDLGGGHELEFVIAPNLHWPDTMFTYDHGTELLYTCDAFGMHYCSDNLVDVESIEELEPHYMLYYDCLMRPNARSVLTALKKCKGMDFKAIATGHGPMLTENTLEWVEKYRSWSEQASEKLGPSVAVFWTSNFGESERLSQVFAHGLTSTGVNVEMHDLNAVDAFELTECLARVDILAVMCPPQGQNAPQGALGSILAGAKEKKHRCVVLESGDPDQEPTELVMRRFAQQGIAEALQAQTLAGEEISPKTMQRYEEAGMGLGKSLSQKAKASKAKSMNKEMERALGRLSSSLYVLTAKKAGLEHAMVASWVTPASETPLGISVSVAKDRAMEPLLRVGDGFTINFLEEGRSLDLMKHFLQKFAPGADRLAGVDKYAGPNGAAILRQACAYLECRITSRMDCSDHWVAYAEVTGGNVAKKEAEVAVHHRKVGTYY